MFLNKESEVLADSVIHFCENRLNELENLTVENKNIFKKSIYKIKNLMRDKSINYSTLEHNAIEVR